MRWNILLESVSGLFFVYQVGVYPCFLIAKVFLVFVWFVSWKIGLMLSLPAFFSFSILVASHFLIILIILGLYLILSLIVFNKVLFLNVHQLYEC